MSKGLRYKNSSNRLAYHFGLNKWLFDKRAERKYGLHVVDGALEYEVERLGDLVTYDLVLIGYFVEQKQAHYFVQVLSDEVHEVHLVYRLKRA